MVLKQARVEDIARQRVTRLHGRIVVVTQYYPRFLKKNLIHEYRHELAPSRELLHQFKEAEKKLNDHDQGFEAVSYETKFTLSDTGLATLASLAEESKAKDVYLVCHCRIGQRCHREILMLTAQMKFSASIAKLSFSWDVTRARLNEVEVDGGIL